MVIIKGGNYNFKFSNFIPTFIFNTTLVLKINCCLLFIRTVVFNTVLVLKINCCLLFTTLVFNTTLVLKINCCLLAQAPFVRVLRQIAVSPHPNLNRNCLHFLSFNRQTFISKSHIHLDRLANVNSPTSFPFFLSKGLFISVFFRVPTTQKIRIYFVSFARNIICILQSFIKIPQLPLMAIIGAFCSIAKALIKVLIISPPNKMSAESIHSSNNLQTCKNLLKLVATAAPKKGHNAINGEFLLPLISMTINGRAITFAYLFYTQVYDAAALPLGVVGASLAGHQPARAPAPTSGAACKHPSSDTSGGMEPKGLETRGTYIFQYITKLYTYGEILLLSTITLQLKLFPIRGKYFLFYAKIPSRVFCKLNVEEMEQYFAKTSSLLETNCMGIRFLLIHLPYIITAVISTNLINYTLIRQLWCT